MASFFFVFTAKTCDFHFSHELRLPQIRGAVADRQAKKAEERASPGITSTGIGWTHEEVPGLGLMPLLMEVEGFTRDEL